MEKLKCQCNRNVVIDYEQTIMGTVTVQDGKIIRKDDFTSMVAVPTGIVLVWCANCESEKRYTKSTQPKWLKELLYGEVDRLNSFGYP